MNKRKGLTLLEVVISMALIGMVAIVFLTIFTSGNKNIFRAGDITKDIFKVQEKIDKQINNLENLKIEELVDGTKIIESPKIRVTIGDMEPKFIQGRFITNESILDKKNVIEMEIITFIPYSPQSKGE